MLPNCYVRADTGHYVPGCAPWRGCRSTQTLGIMTKKLLAILFLLVSAITAHASEPLDVSLVQLIVDPMKYHGKVVKVLAYLHLEFEGNSLYLHKEDFEQSLYKNGIWIDATGNFFQSAKSNNNSYVIVIGTFDASDRGHMGLWSGAINHIERLDRWGKK